MKNFRTILTGINPLPLLRQVEAHPELWNSDEEWMQRKAETVLSAQRNIVLRDIVRAPPGHLPFANRGALRWLDEAVPIVFDLMRALPGEVLAQIIISRMAPGEVIAPHIDEVRPGFPRNYQRYQIPLSVRQGVRFRCGDEELFMKPGNAYWFDNSILHSVENKSTEDRISMRVDIRPFAWT